MARAAKRFDALLSGDQGLEFQLNLNERRLGVIVLVARENRVESFPAMGPQILEALAELQPGTVVRVVA